MGYAEQSTADERLAAEREALRARIAALEGQLRARSELIGTLVGNLKAIAEEATIATTPSRATGSLPDYETLWRKLDGINLGIRKLFASGILS